MIWFAEIDVATESPLTSKIYNLPSLTIKSRTPPFKVRHTAPSNVTRLRFLGS